MVDEPTPDIVANITLLQALLSQAYTWKQGSEDLHKKKLLFALSNSVYNGVKAQNQHRSLLGTGVRKWFTFMKDHRALSNTPERLDISLFRAPDYRLCYSGTNKQREQLIHQALTAAANSSTSNPPSVTSQAKPNRAEVVITSAPPSKNAASARSDNRPKARESSMAVEAQTRPVERQKSAKPPPSQRQGDSRTNVGQNIVAKVTAKETSTSRSTAASLEGDNPKGRTEPEDARQRIDKKESAETSKSSKKKEKSAKTDSKPEVPGGKDSRAEDPDKNASAKSTKRKLSPIPEDPEDTAKAAPARKKTKTSDPPPGFWEPSKPCTSCIAKKRPCWINKENVGCYHCKDVSKRGRCSLSLHPRSRTSTNQKVKKEPVDISIPSVDGAQSTDHDTTDNRASKSPDIEQKAKTPRVPTEPQIETKKCKIIKHIPVKLGQPPRDNESEGESEGDETPSMGVSQPKKSNKSSKEPVLKGVKSVTGSVSTATSRPITAATTSTTHPIASRESSNTRTATNLTDTDHLNAPSTTTADESQVLPIRPAYPTELLTDDALKDLNILARRVFECEGNFNETKSTLQTLVQFANLHQNSAQQLNEHDRRLTSLGAGLDDVRKLLTDFQRHLDEANEKIRDQAVLLSEYRASLALLLGILQAAGFTAPPATVAPHLLGPPQPLSQNRGHPSLRHDQFVGTASPASSTRSRESSNDDSHLAAIAPIIAQANDMKMDLEYQMQLSAAASDSNQSVDDSWAPFGGAKTAPNAQSFRPIHHKVATPNQTFRVGPRPGNWPVSSSPSISSEGKATSPLERGDRRVHQGRTSRPPPQTEPIRLRNDQETVTRGGDGGGEGGAGDMAVDGSGMAAIPPTGLDAKETPINPASAVASGVVKEKLLDGGGRDMVVDGSGTAATPPNSKAHPPNSTSTMASGANEEHSLSHTVSQMRTTLQDNRDP
ncbi:hypothetical protein CC2G_002185 [Coprinopsis cinerea AmutBmut pab1-1]|nr:hypothetical protein CC2G_002185 [Coprinopsis cinerea AmutBmut pab1-1]